MDNYWEIFSVFSAIAALLYFLDHPRLMALVIFAMILACNWVEFAHAEGNESFLPDKECAFLGVLDKAKRWDRT